MDLLLELRVHLHTLPFGPNHRHPELSVDPTKSEAVKLDGGRSGDPYKRYRRDPEQGLYMEIRRQFRMP